MHMIESMLTQSEPALGQEAGTVAQHAALENPCFQRVPANWQDFLNTAFNGMAAGKQRTRDGPDMVADSLGAVPGLARAGVARSAPGGGKSSLLPELASSPSGTGSTISAGAERLQGTRHLGSIMVPGLHAAERSVDDCLESGGDKAALLCGPDILALAWAAPSLQVLNACSCQCFKGFFCYAPMHTDEFTRAPPRIHESTKSAQHVGNTWQYPAYQEM